MKSILHAIHQVELEMARYEFLAQSDWEGVLSPAQSNYLIAVEAQLEVTARMLAVLNHPADNTRAIRLDGKIRQHRTMLQFDQLLERTKKHG